MARKNKVNLIKDRNFKDFPTIVRDNAEFHSDAPVYSYYEGKNIFQISYKDFYENILALGTSFAKLGLSGKTIANCDYTVKIPMYHGVDSLNVAAASAVAFWQLGRK